jgi:hypothetical protein
VTVNYGNPSVVMNCLYKVTQRVLTADTKPSTGFEDRIAHVKRGCGSDRAILDGLIGARTLCGHGVFVHTHQDHRCCGKTDNPPPAGPPTPVHRRK